MFCYCFLLSHFDLHNFAGLQGNIQLKHEDHLKMDFYQLSQEDFHVLEEKILENKEILTNKDSVSIIVGFRILKFIAHILERSAAAPLGLSSRSCATC